MAIYNDISSLLGQLSNQSVTAYATPRGPESAVSQSNEDKDERIPVNRNSFSGSGLSLELSLSSGKEIDLDIRINQVGGLSRLELSSNEKLNANDHKKVQDFLAQLSQSVDELFSGEASSKDLFDFANAQGIEDVDLTAYQDDGDTKQSLEFEKEGRGFGRKIEAQWSEYDRGNGVEENHNLSLRKQEKREDQTSIYGQMNYHWLFDQVNTAMEGVDDRAQGKKLAAFFNSGIQALFSSAQTGNELLQDLGASAQDAKEFIGRSIKVLASNYDGQNNTALSSQQRQMNALPDFNMAFSSERKTLNSTQSEYQLNMDISQVSDQADNSQNDESYQTQNRRLRMDYQSESQKAIYEYTWMRDESLRNVFDGGKLSSSHYRIDEKVETKGRTEGGQKLSYQDRNDIDHF